MRPALTVEARHSASHNCAHRAPRRLAPISSILRSRSPGLRVIASSAAFPAFASGPVANKAYRLQLRGQPPLWAGTRTAFPFHLLAEALRLAFPSHKAGVGTRRTDQRRIAPLPAKHGKGAPPAAI